MRRHALAREKTKGPAVLVGRVGFMIKHLELQSGILLSDVSLETLKAGEDALERAKEAGYITFSDTARAKKLALLEHTHVDRDTSSYILYLLHLFCTVEAMGDATVDMLFGANRSKEDKRAKKRFFTNLRAVFPGQTAKDFRPKKKVIDILIDLVRHFAEKHSCGQLDAREASTKNAIFAIISIGDMLCHSKNPPEIHAMWGRADSSKLPSLDLIQHSDGAHEHFSNRSKPLMQLNELRRNAVNSLWILSPAPSRRPTAQKHVMCRQSTSCSAASLRGTKTAPEPPSTVPTLSPSLWGMVLRGRKKPVHPCRRGRSAIRFGILFLYFFIQHIIFVFIWNKEMSWMITTFTLEAQEYPVATYDQNHNQQPTSYAAQLPPAQTPAPFVLQSPATGFFMFYPSTLLIICYNIFAEIFGDIRTWFRTSD